MASNHRIEFSGQEDGATTAGPWSPRNRLFFLLGATVALWSLLALAYAAWA